MHWIRLVYNLNLSFLAANFYLVIVFALQGEAVATAQTMGELGVNLLILRFLAFWYGE